jgi:hypothetical protein
VLWLQTHPLPTVQRNECGGEGTDALPAALPVR